jgi:hypothetical protein
VRVKTYLALALASALSISAAVATTLGNKLSMSEVAQKASVAIVGKVVASRSAGMNTIATVEVETSVWGTDAARIDVEVPGGTQRNGKYIVGRTVADAPMLFKGDRALLLLTRASGSDNFKIVGFNQGMLRVLPTTEGDAVMLPGAGKLTSLNSAMNEIREARNAEKSNNGLR